MTKQFESISNSLETTFIPGAPVDLSQYVDGKFITKDGTESTRFDNLIMVETTVENGEKTVKEYK